MGLRSPNGNRKLCRHQPIFPGRFQPSIFGANELNFCVRDGNRWDLIAINTDYWVKKHTLKIEQRKCGTKICLLGQALDRLVHASLTCHHAYTLCLSTL